ncbi:MAG: hypothetical protein WAW90_01555 [Minisyncoccia bacterium]
MTFAQFVASIISALNLVVIPTIFTLAAAAFIWGVLSHFIFHGSEEKSREEGKQFILWGLVGIVLMFSFWGVLNLLLSTLGINPGIK